MPKWANFLAIDSNCADQSAVVEHRHNQKGARATLVDERDKWFMTPFVGWFLPEVRDVNTLLGGCKARERDVAYVSLDGQCRALPGVHVRWHAMPGHRAKGILIAKEEIAKLRFANARGAGQYCGKHWLKLAGGA